MDLIEFYRARLNEVEQDARDAIDHGFDSWAVADHEVRVVSPGSVRPDGLGAPMLVGVTRAPAVHAARWDPAAVLRDVAAKRRVLHEFEDVSRAAADDPDDVSARIGKFSLGLAVAALAAAHEQHPDYRPEWTP